MELKFSLGQREMFQVHTRMQHNDLPLPTFALRGRDDIPGDLRYGYTPSARDRFTISSAGLKNAIKTLLHDVRHQSFY